MIAVDFSRCIDDVSLLLRRIIYCTINEQNA